MPAERGVRPLIQLAFGPWFDVGRVVDANDDDEEEDKEGFEEGGRSARVRLIGPFFSGRRDGGGTCRNKGRLGLGGIGEKVGKT